MDNNIYASKCIDDHEQRLRHLEANNKEQAKLFVISEKLESQIRALDDKTQVRFAAVEKYIDQRSAVTESERYIKTESKSDLFSMVALVVSVASFIILFYKLIIS